MATSIIDSVIWRRRDEPGHDACTLRRTDHGRAVEGVAVFLHRKMACCLEYKVICDENWATQSALVEGTIGRSEVELSIRRTKRGWLCNGRLQRDLADCSDIDLSFTPATNIIPVRRLKLRVGASADVVAAWLRFPGLTMHRLDQEYQNLGSGAYAYIAFKGRFKRKLSIRPSGLIKNYPGLWSQEGAA